MKTIELSAFTPALTTLLRHNPTIRSEDITPTLYDIIEPLLNDEVNIQMALAILKSALVFVTTRDVQSREFIAERREFTLWSNQLTVSYASVIGMFEQTDICHQVSNKSWLAAFTQLTDSLASNGIDSPTNITNFTHVLITLISLAYLSNLPMVSWGDLNTWCKLDINSASITNDVTSCAADRDVLRVIMGNEYVYTNTLTKRIIRLPLDQEFHPVHYIAIGSKSMSGYMADLAYYGMDEHAAEALLSQVSGTVI